MLRNFQNQDWPSKELLIADDGQDSVADLCEGLPNVRYFRVPTSTIGAKKNFLCSMAQGEVMSTFDDDDFYARGYLTRHVDSLRRYDVACTGFYEAPFVNRQTGQAFIYRNNIHYCIGATITFTKGLWKCHPFQDLSLAEDNTFLRSIGDVYRFTHHDGLFIATDHGRNTSPRDYERSDSFDGAALLEQIGHVAKPKNARKAKAK